MDDFHFFAHNQKRLYWTLLYCITSPPCTSQEILSYRIIRKLKYDDIHLGVGHGGQGPLDAAHSGGHGEKCRHSQRHPGRHRLVVQPEGEPGHHHDHEAGDVDGDDVEGELPGEHQVNPQAAVFTWYRLTGSGLCGSCTIHKKFSCFGLKTVKVDLKLC